MALRTALGAFAIYTNPDQIDWRTFAMEKWFGSSSGLWGYVEGRGGTRPNSYQKEKIWINNLPSLLPVNTSLPKDITWHFSAFFQPLQSIPNFCLTLNRNLRSFQTQGREVALDDELTPNSSCCTGMWAAVNALFQCATALCFCSHQKAALSTTWRFTAGLR